MALPRRPWEFTVRALYTSASRNFDRTILYGHWAYLNEGRDARRRGDNANPYVSGTIAYYQWSRGWDVQLDLEREGVDD